MKRTQDFIRGQRWISDTEAELGLGIVLSTDLRHVTLLFPACNETRVYAQQTAPLTRVRFQPGDTVTSHADSLLMITQVDEQAGLLTYQGRLEDGKPAQLTEGELSHFIQFSKPQDRLFSGQIDANAWFELRYATHRKRNSLLQSPVRGLIGPRISLIPHQLYIAHEVANRHAPRVLLADEVGLGKTIEAGLIIHQQLFTERARRVLLLLPDSLCHQWLVEMRRRFNLNFSIFDAERCLDAEVEGNSEGRNNPFHSEQLILCSLSFLRDNPQRHQQALAGDWDLLVVDEAHHLAWDEGDVSLEYRCVEQLAQATRGLLLLTATPEQLGEAGHFARLRLLDADRFYDYRAFLAEDAHYAPVAEAVQHLLNGETLPAQATQTLLKTLGESAHADWLLQVNDSTASETERDTARQHLLALLLDRHGTGRVLFRNTRTAIQGFPERRLFAYPLPMPAVYQAQSASATILSDLLYPERFYKLCPQSDGVAWMTQDPRVSCLQQLLAAHKTEKFLVICAHADTALDLETTLYHAGLRVTVFHEGMSIVQRDRAAAYFADSEPGARVLVCSEIGSEGRNFQFAHHLVLFDLPLNPDLLEQRIGRLDRIGQQQTIHIHVPYLQGGTQDVLYHWYHQGLSAFEQTSPASSAVFAQLQDALLQVLATYPAADAELSLDALLAQTQRLRTQLQTHLSQGRDHLLELNSCRLEPALRLQIAISDADCDAELQPYLEQFCEGYGIQFEEQGPHTYLMHPGNHMLAGGLPGLEEDGITVTFERATALAREEVQFLTWEHPLLRSAMDWVLTGEIGNTAVIAVKIPPTAAAPATALRPGTLLLECLFSLTCPAPRALQAERFLPPVTLRTLLDKDCQDWREALPPGVLRRYAVTIDSNTARAVVRSQRAFLQTMLTHSDALARQRLPRLISEALARMQPALTAEIERLTELRQFNPNVREAEIQFLQQQRLELESHLQATQLRLDALRVIVGA